MRASRITAIDFFEDLTSPYARKRFFWGLSLLSILFASLAACAQYFIQDQNAQNLILSLMTELFAGVTVILIFYFLYMYFIGPNDELRRVSVLRHQDISDELEKLPVNVTHYAFWGRSGSYFRSVPLIKLDQVSKDEKKTIHVDVIMPDPSDPRLIDAYHDILVALGEAKDDKALLPNVLATCIVCAILQSNNRFLKIRIYKSKSIPICRIDLSDNGVVITQDDKRKPALYFGKESDFHEMYRNMIYGEAGVSEEIFWDERIFKGLKLEEKSCCKETLNAFGFCVEDFDDLQIKVARLVSERPHRYK